MINIQDKSCRVRCCLPPNLQSEDSGVQIEGAVTGCADQINYAWDRRRRPPQLFAGKSNWTDLRVEITESNIK